MVDMQPADHTKFAAATTSTAKAADPFQEDMLESPP
jgi:hypothetical protein